MIESVLSTVLDMGECFVPVFMPFMFLIEAMISISVIFSTHCSQDAKRGIANSVCLTLAAGIVLGIRRLLWGLGGMSSMEIEMAPIDAPAFMFIFFGGLLSVIAVVQFCFFRIQEVSWEKETIKEDDIENLTHEDVNQRDEFAKQTERIESLLESISNADISLQGKKLIKQAKRLLSFLPEMPKSDTLGKLTSYYMPETLALLGKFERLEEQGVLQEVNVENISASLKTVTKIIQQVIAEAAEPDVMDINVGSAVLIKMSKLNGLDDENPFGQKSA